MPHPPAPWEGSDYSGCAAAYVGGFLFFIAIPTIFVLGLLQGLALAVVPAFLYGFITADQRWRKAARKIYEEQRAESRTIRLERKQVGTSRYGRPLYAYTAHLGETEAIKLAGVPDTMVPHLDQDIPVRIFRHPEDASTPVVIAHEQAIMISKMRPPWAKASPISRT